MNPEDKPQVGKMRSDGTFRMYVKDKDGNEVSYLMKYEPPRKDLLKTFNQLVQEQSHTFPGSIKTQPKKPVPKPKKPKIPPPFSTSEEELSHRQMLVKLLTPEELALPDIQRERLYIMKELVYIGALRDIDTIGCESDFHEEAAIRAYRRNKFSFFSWYCLLRGKWIAVFWVTLILSFLYIYITSASFWDTRDPYEVRRELEMKYNR